MKFEKIKTKDGDGHIRPTTLRTFTVDFSSLDDIKKALNVLKSAASSLSVLEKEGYISKKESVRRKFFACQEIYSHDIAKLYEDITLDTERKYYIYAHCDPNKKIAFEKDGRTTFAATLGMKFIPFYVGKGTGNRAFEFEFDRNGSHRKIRQKIKKFGKEIEAVIIESNLTEKEALMKESKLIDIFGLASYKGLLVNYDEGIKNKERKQLYQDKLALLSLFYNNSV